MASAAGFTQYNDLEAFKACEAFDTNALWDTTTFGYPVLVNSASYLEELANNIAKQEILNSAKVYVGDVASDSVSYVLGEDASAVISVKVGSQEVAIESATWANEETAPGTIDLASGKFTITPTGAGTQIITITSTYEGVEIVKELEVEVVVNSIEAPILFSSMDDTAEIPSELEGITSITSEDGTVQYFNGTEWINTEALKAGNTSLDSEIKETVVIVTTEDNVYMATVKAYSKLIYDAEDFLAIRNDAFYGTALLMNNISITANSYPSTPNYFYGKLDGNGYVIESTLFDYTTMFGNFIIEPGYIKNTTFVLDVGSNNAVKAFGTYFYNTIEDCTFKFVSTTEFSLSGNTIYHRITSSLPSATSMKLRNVVFDYSSIKFLNAVIVSAVNPHPVVAKL